MASIIRALLDRNGTPIGEFGSLLDFGCGCGRVIRHWKDENGTAICGSDYNPLLVDWCRDNLGFAEFTVNGLKPDLPHEDGRFDLIYALSVFTHLPEDLQEPWMAELNRVLSPGGTLLVTVFGLAHLGRLDADQRESFLAGDLVVTEPAAAGTNECGAYHPERYVYDEFSKGLEVTAFLPDAARGMEQDVVLLSKPS